MGGAIISTGASLGVPCVGTDAAVVFSSADCVLKSTEFISKDMELRVKHHEHISKSTLNLSVALPLVFVMTMLCICRSQGLRHRPFISNHGAVFFLV